MDGPPGVDGVVEGVHLTRKHIRTRQEIEEIGKIIRGPLNEAHKRDFAAHVLRPREAVDHLPRVHRIEKFGADGIAPNENGIRLINLKRNVGLDEGAFADTVEQAPVRREKRTHERVLKNLRVFERRL
jgi:hypothetical protein